MDLQGEPTDDKDSTAYPDGVFTRITLGVALEKTFEPLGNSKVIPYLSAGIGAGIIGDEDVSGSTETGAIYNIETDAGTEIIPNIILGIDWSFSDEWFLELAARADYHIADWDVEDKVSGAKESIDSYFAYGFQLGIGKQF